MANSRDVRMQVPWLVKGSAGGLTAEAGQVTGTEYWGVCRYIPTYNISHYAGT